MHWNDNVLPAVRQHRHGWLPHYDEDFWRLREWYDRELWNGGRLKVHPVHMALPTLGEPQAAADEPEPECREKLCFPVWVHPVGPPSRTLPQPRFLSKTEVEEAKAKAAAILQATAAGPAAVPAWREDEIVDPVLALDALD